MIGEVQGHAGAEVEAPSVEELRTRYDAYRVRQARVLVGMLPHEVIRPLYRRAVRATSPKAEAPEDPLAVLVDFCEALLPLPPFQVWLLDVTRNPAAHLRALEHAPDAPTVAAPETVESRSFESGGRRWTARCRAFRDRDAWRGFIAFRSADNGPAPRTTLIFRESDPVALRERFLGFERAALEAFLRSALP